MSHRKFEAPRHGHLGYLPRKRCKRGRGRIKSFPADDQSKKVGLTAFIGYKAGMTHVCRDYVKSGQKIATIEIIEPVTIIETPPMNVLGVTGYVQTPWGLKNVTTVWGRKISNLAKRRVANKWRGKNKNHFRNHQVLYNTEEYKKDRELKYEALAGADVIRVLASTQTNKVNLVTKKAHILEIQVNGGDVAAKIKYAQGLIGTEIRLRDVFEPNQMIDAIAINKGKGTKGVVSRWGVTRLPRKTHRGLRKVACIGSWHPSRVMYSVARAGNKGFHHRVQRNCKIYMMGAALSDNENKAQGRFAGVTKNDLTKKGVNPVGGFPHYGKVTEDFVMVRGSVPGSTRRAITLRKPIYPQTKKRQTQEVPIKFLDTSSKTGRGRHQTKKEKRETLGLLKKEILENERRALLKRKREETSA